jgi:hypothetical protein
MSGYDYDAGMSVNALDAYDEGRKPLSKITLQNLRFAGWKGTKTLAMSLAKSGFWRTSEWHHSGGTWYNKVDFYDPSELVDFWDSCDDQRKLELQNTNSKKTDDDDVRVKGSFVLWGGSRRSPRRVGEQDFEGIKKGNWIHLDTGGKKKATGNHITYAEI